MPVLLVLFAHVEYKNYLFMPEALCSDTVARMRLYYWSPIPFTKISVLIFKHVWILWKTTIQNCFIRSSFFSLLEEIFGMFQKKKGFLKNIFPKNIFKTRTIAKKLIDFLITVKQIFMSYQNSPVDSDRQLFRSHHDADLLLTYEANCSVLFQLSMIIIHLTLIVAVCKDSCMYFMIFPKHAT